MPKIKLLLLVFASFLLLAICFKAAAQPLPTFELKLTNGKTLQSKNLSNTAPLILVYFAPDCDHCQVLMNEMFKKIASFKKAQLVLVTFKPLSEVADFEKNYAISKYQNIKVGTESPVFFFRQYYNLQNTPFTALYNKERKLVISYKKETPVDDLIKHLNKLK